MGASLRQEFFVEALGCISNRVDASRVEEFFKANGWVRAESIEEASVIILMSCGFTEVSENYNIERLIELQHRKKGEAQIMVGGCLPSINKERLYQVFNGPVFSPRTMSTLNTLIPSKVSIEAISPTADDGLTKALRISTGCMSHCSYCAIPFANGRTKSRSIDEILEDVERITETGFRKIRLVSEDVGAYGQDVGLSIADLLSDLAACDGRFEIYLDNLNPNWFFQYKTELIDLFHSEKIAKRFNVPIQSGSNRLLSLMRRDYTIAEVQEVLECLLEALPQSKISTDLIVGFPTETEEDFEATKSLLEGYPFCYVEIFTYEDRPRIGALKLEPKIPDRTKEDRRQILFQCFLLKFLTTRNVSNNDQLSSLLGKYDQLPVNFNLVL